MAEARIKAFRVLKIGLISWCRSHPIRLFIHNCVSRPDTEPGTHRAIRNITQLSTIADPQKSVKQ
jgi:hypothetical protein